LDGSLIFAAAATDQAEAKGAATRTIYLVGLLGTALTLGMTGLAMIVTIFLHFVPISSYRA
jgi:hypothetical protein